MKRLLACLLTALLLLSGSCSAAFADIETLTIAQIYQEHADDTRLHVRIESSAAVSGTATPITPDNIVEATVGTGDTPVLDVRSVRDASFAGMSYVFVLDHAMNIGSERVKELKTGMNEWIDSMSERDCAVIIVSEEEEIRVLTDGFTSDKDVLHAAVDDYGRANENPSKNKIFSAIREGILIAANRDCSLPQNCCIIVCSNGADTYKTQVTAEELSSLLSENNLPMYVVGFAYRARMDALTVLVNMAKNSYGWTEDASPVNDDGTIDEAFERLCRRIAGGYDIALDCSDGFVFNGATLVSVRFSAPETLLKRTADLYLLSKNDETSAPRMTARPQTAATQNQSAAPSPTTASSVQYGELMGKALSAVDGFAPILLRQTEIGGVLLPNCVLLGGCAILLIIAVMLVRTARRRNRVGKTEPIHEDNQIDNSEMVTSRPDQPYALPDSSDEIQTERVRGQTHGQSVIMQDADRMNEDRSVQNAAKHYVSIMTVSYRIPGQEWKEQAFFAPVEVTVGREVGNTLTIPYECVSGRHAMISCEGEQVFISNISEMRNGEQNALYLNERLVMQKTKMLSPSRINVGMVPMTVSWTLTDDGAPCSEDDDKTVRLRPQEEDQTVRVNPVVLIVSWTVGQHQEERRVPLVDEVSIGRDRKDTVAIEDPEKTVSKRHIVVVRTQDGLAVRNGSREDFAEGKNPFFVGNKKIVDEIPFEDGMTIYAGKVRITIRRDCM